MLVMRHYGSGFWNQETGRRDERREGIVDGENVKGIVERWCRWMDLITIGLKAEAPAVC
jgi:hypothetical protein